jgi:hypothetical protein
MAGKVHQKRKAGRKAEKKAKKTKLGEHAVVAQRLGDLLLVVRAWSHSQGLQTCSYLA